LEVPDLIDLLVLLCKFCIAFIFYSPPAPEVFDEASVVMDRSCAVP